MLSDVCVCVCVFVCRKGGVLGSPCNLTRRQLQPAKKKREREIENKMKAASAVSAFSLVLHFCQNRTAEDVNNADNCLLDRLTRGNCKRKGGRSTSYHAA